MNVDDYVHALEFELRDQPRRVRRTEAADLREHLEELPDGTLARLDAPGRYAHEYRAQRNLRRRRIIGAWRGISRAGRIVIVALVIALVAAVAIPPWIAHYQPVTAGLQSGGPDTAPMRSEHDATVFSYRDGGIVRIGLKFDNPGRFDAEITGLEVQPYRGVLQLAGVRVTSRVQDCCAFELSRPARFPVRVPARATRWIMLEFRMTNCEFYGNGDSVGYDRFRFPMTILGVHHVVTAMLFGDKIFVDMPGQMTRYCPRQGSS
jgi:hypothetical protein